MKKKSELYDLNKWPTISQAVQSLSPLQVAESEGAVRFGERNWKFKGKIVTEEFLIDYIRSGGNI